MAIHQRTTEIKSMAIRHGFDSVGIAQATELTDAEKEELQRMESLMRRVPDDPAFLLKRKMQLEAQKRQRQRMPSNRSDW